MDTVSTFQFQLPTFSVFAAHMSIVPLIFEIKADTPSTWKRWAPGHGWTSSNDSFFNFRGRSISSRTHDTDILINFPITWSKLLQTIDERINSFLEDLISGNSGIFKIVKFWKICVPGNTLDWSYKFWNEWMYGQDPSKHFLNMFTSIGGT